MSDLRCAGANVELSDFFRLAAPLLVQMEDVTDAASPPAANDRRLAGRSRRRAAVAGRPAGSGARRNERERNRVRQVNAGFDRLRDHVPQGRRNRKLSKVDTLRAAVEYIGHLQTILGYSEVDTPPNSDVADENYLDPAVAGSIEDDVDDRWYLDARFCGSVEGAPAEESSMLQLLVSPEDFTRALGASLVVIIVIIPFSILPISYLAINSACSLIRRCEDYNKKLSYCLETA